ncbi:hypothetical protein [Fusobacterium mortiferum]|uniref:hypothetical protein n=1 Tax=Fusobacterium mortiferum TaxID=850 RepID=UPI003569451E
MVKKIIMFLSMLFIKNLYGEFREVIPLENENIKKNIVTEKFEITKIKSENIKEKNSKMIPEAEEKNKKNEKIDEVIHVKDSENVKEVIEKNSVTIITEEHLNRLLIMLKILLFQITMLKRKGSFLHFLQRIHLNQIFL